MNIGEQASLYIPVGRIFWSVQAETFNISFHDLITQTVFPSLEIIGRVRHSLQFLVDDPA
jgi:hypothetical protein